MGTSRRSILRVIAAQKKLTPGEAPKRKVGYERLRKTSEMTDKLIKHEVTINPKITAVELKYIIRCCFS
jgi:hypothetical protein